MGNITREQKRLSEAFDRGIVRGREDALRELLFEFHNQSATLLHLLRETEYRLMGLVHS